MYGLEMDPQTDSQMVQHRNTMILDAQRERTSRRAGCVHMGKVTKNYPPESIDKQVLKRFFFFQCLDVQSVTYDVPGPRMECGWWEIRDRKTPMCRPSDHVYVVWCMRHSG